MKSLSPHVLRLTLKKTLKLLEQEEREEAIKQLLDIHNALDTHTHEYLDDIKEDIDNHLTNATILLFLNIPAGSIEHINHIMTLLRNVFMQNLWMTSRLLASTPDKDALGTLYSLPEGIRFRIYQDLYDAL